MTEGEALPLARNKGTRWVLLDAYHRLKGDRYRLAVYVWLSCQAPRVGGHVAVPGLPHLAKALGATVKPIRAALLHCEELGTIAITGDLDSGPFNVVLLDVATGYTRGSRVDGHYFRVNPAIFTLGLNAGGIAVYTVLRNYVNGATQSCYPSRETIGGEAGLHRDNVTDRIKELVAAGVVRKALHQPAEPDKHAYNKYFLLQFGPEPVEEPEVDTAAAVVNTLAASFRSRYAAYTRHVRGVRLAAEIDPADRNRMIAHVRRELGKGRSVTHVQQELETWLAEAARLDGAAIHDFSYLCSATNRNRVRSHLEDRC